MTLFDPGLQPERTELAWRRTALALAVGSLVAMRLLPAALDDVRLLGVGIAGLVATGGLWSASRRRLRAVGRRLEVDGDRAPLPGGTPIAALSALVALAGGAGLAAVLVAALR